MSHANANNITIEEISASLPGVIRPESLRTAQMALKKYGTLFQNNDAVHLFRNLEDVKDRFLSVLAEHSVRHYMFALVEVARLPHFSKNLFGEDTDAGIALVDKVAADCNKLSTKVPRKAHRGSENDTSFDHDDDGVSFGEGAAKSAVEDALREEVASLRATNSGLELRLEDAKSYINGLLTIIRPSPRECQGSNVAALTASRDH